MWLILAQDGDVEAGWLAERLRARARRRVELVEASELVHECRWEHRIGTGTTSSRLVVGDRTVIDSAEVDGVVNRLGWLSAEGFEGAPPADRDYAAGELFALGLSWLESLGSRVLNRPSGMGLAGAWRTPGQWRALASSVGLPIVPYDSDADDTPDQAELTVLVVDGRVLGSPPAEAARLVDLQRASGLDLIEIGLSPSHGGTTPGSGGAVHGVSFLPPLRRYGRACAGAVLAALTRRGAR
jgi:hypothetical protein